MNFGDLTSFSFQQCKGEHTLDDAAAPTSQSKHAKRKQKLNFTRCFSIISLSFSFFFIFFFHYYHRGRDVIVAAVVLTFTFARFIFLSIAIALAITRINNEVFGEKMKSYFSDAFSAFAVCVSFLVIS